MQEAAAQQQSLLALKKKQYEVKFDLDGTKYLPIENIGTGKESVEEKWCLIYIAGHRLGSRSGY